MRPVDEYPIAYATIQNNLGIAYRMLAQVKDVEINLKKAFDAHYEAMMIYSVENDPTGYATTQNELGNAFLLLAQIKDKDSNLENAIDAYYEALEIFTENKYPTEYRIIISNQKKAQDLLKDNYNRSTN